MSVGIFLKLSFKRTRLQSIGLEIVLKTIRINFKTSKSHLEIRSDKFREHIH